jgi:Tfp pilus assembly protein PilO
MSPRKTRIDLRQMARPILTAYLALLVVNVLFYGLVVRPRAVSYRRILTESEPTLQRIRQREAEVKSRELFLAALERATNDLERLRTDVLSTRDRRMIDAQLEVWRIARQFNVNLQRIQYENSRLEDEGLERFAMVVPLEGGYGSLRKFIQAVENSDKFLVIEQVALATGRDGGALIQLNIVVATYFDDPGASAAKAARRRVAVRT